jgi:hypothetical protein
MRTVSVNSMEGVSPNAASLQLQPLTFKSVLLIFIPKHLTGFTIYPQTLYSLRIICYIKDIPKRLIFPTILRRVRTQNSYITNETVLLWRHNV